MKKIGIFAVAALLFLFVSLIWGIGWEDTAAEPTGSMHSWEPPETICDPDNLELLRRLMRWYNLNLHDTSPEEHYQDTYLTIVPTSMGLLGYVELEVGVYMPIYPDGYEKAEGYGFVHTMDSGFPVVGMSSYSVLTWTGGRETYDHWFREGDVFWLYILDQVQAYRVEAVTATEPDFSAWEGEEVCAFLLPGEAGEDVWVLCAAVNENGLNGRGKESNCRKSDFWAVLSGMPQNT